MPKRLHSASRSRGFSIVEAMVALVVMSVGMLGIAGLYVSSLKAGRTAILRTQAVNLAADIADRIRANRSARNAYDTTVAAPCSAPGGGTTLQETASRNLAATDTCQWVANVQAVLPAGAAQVTYVAPAAVGMPNVYIVVVSWQEPGEQTGFTYTLRVQAS